MEIVKFKKGKKNFYEVYLNNGSILKLYDDVIIKYNLLVNKKLDNKSLNKIIEYNDSLGAYYESLKKISTKLRSEVELRNYLEKKEYSKEIIDNTIKKLAKDGYLNRDLYIKSYVNDAYMFSNDGPDKIKKNLNKLGFNNEEINNFLDKDFEEKAIKLIDKKVKSNHKYNTYLLKQHINTYLINLGYSRDLFITYLDNISVDSHSILENEVKSLITKYEKKYQNEKLIYFIKDKLYKKGYNSDEIGEVLSELL